ncbi:D-alanyl-D-alanine carboxypeptidase/D-alanyl-D-alanine endopeptidase [Undibacterium sp. Ren11W]|uniref:D-alanyl-D-alanine carboxypeptidase/D-alanyl-D-alanine endopeptidase n=1 Tax=Undibacterium sp. Ren11W TaxID=3413045 RepID=UPI003BF2D183
MFKLTALLLPFIFWSLPVSAQTELPMAVDAALKKANIATGNLSLMVLPATGGNPVLSQYAERAMNPASTMKLLTTQVALDELGPNFRWKTQILADTAVKQEVLSGKLYLRGGGDPNLTWDKLAIMLRKLRQQGLRKIEGDIVLDRSYLQPTRPDLNTSWFDEAPDAYYNVVPDALLVHSNIIAFALEADASKLSVRLMTPLDKITINNRLQLNNKPCADWEKTWLPPTIESGQAQQIEITLNGSFPRRCEKTTYLNLLDRNLYIAHMLRLLWQEMGGIWQGQAVDGVTPASAILLGERQSDTLADTLRIINKYSDNSMARLLYMTLGAESVAANTYPDHLQAAQARVRSWLALKGINDQALVLENGSGLSRIERVSAAQLASVLQVAARSNWYPEFASSLPIVALDGTMRKRLKTGLNGGNARIKTGSIKDAISIAGYVRDVHELNWIVVGIINGENAGKGRPALDELIAWVAAGQP